MKFTLDPGDIVVRKTGNYAMLLADNRLLIAVKGPNDEVYKPCILKPEDGLFPAEPNNVKQLVPGVKAIFLTARLLMGVFDNRNLESGDDVLRKN